MTGVTAGPKKTCACSSSSPTRAALAIRNARTGAAPRMGGAAPVDPAARRATDAAATVREIGQAICAELNQLIDYHNVRVYRVVGRGLRARRVARPRRRVRGRGR